MTRRNRPRRAVAGVLGAMVLAGTLAACGADGPPRAPEPAPPPGVSVTGEALIGVSGTL